MKRIATVIVGSWYLVLTCFGSNEYAKHCRETKR